MKSFTKHKRKSRFHSEEVQRRKKRNRKIAFGIFMLLLVGLGFKFTESHIIPGFKRLPMFQFKKIVAEGTEHISAKELRRLIGKPSGENLFDVDLNKLKNKIRKNPWVLDVRVRRLYPDRIHIEVLEKKAVAILLSKRLYFLDDKGSIIARVSPGDKVDFTIISGISKNKILTSYDLNELYNENEFLKQWPLSEIHWKKNGVTFFTKNPSFEIRLGKNEYSKQFLRLEKVLKDLSQKNRLPRLVDLNFSKKVVVKVAK